METALKKKQAAVSVMGRPKKGALSSFPKKLVQRIKKIKGKRPGWGTPSILIELQDVYGYELNDLPCERSIHLYLHEQGLTQHYEPHGKYPKESSRPKKAVHALWEIDAQGATKVKDLGYVATINMKDSRSLKYCMSFPIAVVHQRCQPKTNHYRWAFRSAFLESGLPVGIQADKDSVFIENTTKSPYPTKLFLWWIGLGVKVYFIKVPPPKKQAKVERSHQTIDKQVLMGQAYSCWQELWKEMNKRRKLLNERLPCSSLNGQAPLQAFPKAAHSGRSYSIKQEYHLFQMEHIYKFLSKSFWYRRVSSVKTISLGGQIYYLKKATPKSQIKITFSKRTKLFIFRNDKELLLAKLAPKGLSKLDIIGASNKELKSIQSQIKRNRDFPL